VRDEGELNDSGGWPARWLDPILGGAFCYVMGSYLARYWLSGEPPETVTCKLSKSAPVLGLGNSAGALGGCSTDQWATRRLFYMPGLPSPHPRAAMQLVAASVLRNVRY
jgi:hypothetical protein